MLLDFNEHRLHRRALSVAFKAGPMRSYLELLNAGIAANLSKWPRGVEMRVYPAMKQLTLDLAGASFLGLQLGPDTETLMRALSAMIAAAVAPIRASLPGTKMRQGVKSRAYVVDYFKRQIPARRESGGDDLFSHLMTKAHALEDPAQEGEADVDLHLLIYEAAHNVVLLHVMRALADLLRNNIFYSRSQLYLREGVRDRLLQQHLALAEAVIAGNVKEAEAAAAEHIRFTFETVEEIRRDDLRLETSLHRVQRSDLVAE